MTKRILSLIMALLICLFGIGCATTTPPTPQKPSQPTQPDTPDPTPDPDPEPEPELPVVDNKKYQSYWMPQFDYQTMPIVGFVAPPTNKDSTFYTRDFITKEDFEDVKKSGLNTIIGLYENYPSFGEQVIKSLKLSKEVDLSYIMAVTNLHNSTDLTTIKTILMPFVKTNYTALGGLKVYDEPNYPLFANMKKSKDNLEKLLPNKLYYSNLFPYGGDKWTYYGPTAAAIASYDYDTYIEDYMRIYKPQMLSYDNYPLYENNVVNAWYFSNMSVIRKVAAQNEVPFWTYIQASKFNTNTRLPNQADINWLVNTSLSFGAKGIQYFTYFKPEPNGMETFQGSFIDENGVKSPIYGYAQAANKQIAAVDEVLMQSLSKGLMLSGSTPAPIPGDIVLTSYKQLTQVSGNNALVGCFDYNGNAAYYATNNHLTLADNITLTFSQETKGYTVIGGVKAPFSGSSLILELSAGAAALVVIE